MNQQARRLLTLILTILSCEAATYGVSLPPGDIVSPPYSLNNGFNSIEPGTTLTLLPGSMLGDFSRAGDRTGASSGAILNVLGGAVGATFQAYPGSLVDIQEGMVGSGLQTHEGSEVRIQGGNVGNFFNANAGSTVSVSGGTIASGFTARADSQVSISGGDFEGFFNAYLGSDVTISGGTFGPSFRANTGSRVEIRGTQFFFDGESVAVSQRDVRLTGLLQNGDPLDFGLNSTFESMGDEFTPGATLVLTMVPEPDGWVLACLLLCCISVRFNGRTINRWACCEAA